MCAEGNCADTVSLEMKTSREPQAAPGDNVGTLLGETRTAPGGLGTRRDTSVRQGCGWGPCPLGQTDCVRNTVLRLLGQRDMTTSRWLGGWLWD